MEKRREGKIYDIYEKQRCITKEEITHKRKLQIKER